MPCDNEEKQDSIIYLVIAIIAVCVVALIDYLSR